VHAVPLLELIEKGRKPGGLRGIDRYLVRPEPGGNLVFVEPGVQCPV
jgi:hypothetical protein